MYFPYLHFDTYQSVVRRRDQIRRRLYHGRAAPVPEDVAKLESLELRVIWEYIGYDPPINCRRTLDQFGYPSLQDTSTRDDDQMLYKLTKQDLMPPSSRALPTDGGRLSSSRRSTQSRLSSKTNEEVKGREDELCYDRETNLRDGKLLMVDELWLWAIDTSKVLMVARTWRND